jgi:hypothetical protein
METFVKNNCTRWHASPVLSFGLVAMTCCTRSTQAAAPQAIDVEVVEVEQRDAPIYGQWIATLDGFVNADVKAQVTGYLLKQEYKEGSLLQVRRIGPTWPTFGRQSYSEDLFKPRLTN